MIKTEPTNNPSGEQTIAFCYLHRAGDERNRCVLMQEHLLVIRKGQLSTFVLEQVKHIGFEQRRWLLPLVTGGIVAPFALLAIFLHLYALWPLFMLFLAASLVFYLGWMEHTVLSIRDQVKTHDFPLPYVSSNLSNFIRFTLRYRYRQENTLYHMASAEDWAQAKKQGVYRAASLQQQGFIHASDRQQLARLQQSGILANDQEWVILVIDPLQVQPEIRFEPADDLPGFTADSAELFPHIYGPLNLEAIVRAEPWELNA